MMAVLWAAVILVGVIGTLNLILTDRKSVV